MEYFFFFSCSYRALYNSLVGEKFPEGMNHETFSMIFASLTQLFNKIRTEEINNRTVLLKSAKRCLLKKQPNQSKVNHFLTSCNKFSFTSLYSNYLYFSYWLL